MTNSISISLFNLLILVLSPKLFDLLSQYFWMRLDSTVTEYFADHVDDVRPDFNFLILYFSYHFQRLMSESPCAQIFEFDQYHTSYDSYYRAVVPEYVLCQDYDTQYLQTPLQDRVQLICRRAQTHHSSKLDFDHQFWNCQDDVCSDRRSLRYIISSLNGICVHYDYFDIRLTCVSK